MADTELPNVEMTQETHHEGGEYPFWQDLNPDFLASENYGEQGPHPEKSAPTAYDVKGAHDRWRGLEDGELKQIPILPAGGRVEQGAIYIDLRLPHPQEFTATGNMEADREHWYVPKASVPYWIWNRLIGMDNPERLDQADET